MFATSTNYLSDVRDSCTVAKRLVEQLDGSSRGSVWMLNRGWRALVSQCDQRCLSYANQVVQSSLSHSQACLRDAFVQEIDPDRIQAHLTTFSAGRQEQIAGRVSQIFSWNQLHELIDGEGRRMELARLAAHSLLPELSIFGAKCIQQALKDDYEPIEPPPPKDELEEMVDADLARCADSLIAGTVHQFQYISELLVGAALAEDIEDALATEEFQAYLCKRLIGLYRRPLVESYRQTFAEAELRQWLAFRKSSLGRRLYGLSREWERELQMQAVEFVSAALMDPPTAP